jgi:hypothetical protein
VSGMFSSPRSRLLNTLSHDESRFESQVIDKAGTSKRVKLVITIAPKFATGLDVDDLNDIIEKATKKVGSQKPPYKVSVETRILPM